MTAEAPVRLDPAVETWALEVPDVLSEQAFYNLRWSLKEQMPGKQVVIVTSGARFRALEPLDAAWRAVGDAMPEGWRLHLLEATVTDEWRAVAGNRHDTGTDPFIAIGEGPTPAAALNALAAKLPAVPA